MDNFKSTRMFIKMWQPQSNPHSNISYYCNELLTQFSLQTHPNHANIEYLRFLSSCRDFRFILEPTASSSKKRNLSTDLGQAFFRYFMYEFMGVTYFAHMDKILDKSTHPAFNGMMIKRKDKGDVPDYLCAKSVTHPFIGEAKGRFSNINFTSKAFADWRLQFSRIEVLDKNNIPKKLKGFTIATKFTTERNQPTNKSKLFAEDPETPGEEFLTDNEIGIARGCIAIHYSRILSRLGLNLLSTSLESGFVVPEELSFNLPVWRCNFGPIKGERFVGGFFSETEPQMVKTESNRFRFQPNILKLGIPSPVFLGLRTSTLKTLRKVCLGNWEQLAEIPKLVDTDFRPSNLAWLRDGTISGGLEFFEFEGIETF